MEYKKTRQGYADALIELAEEIPNLVVLDADVAKATQTCDFEAVYPHRFFNCGVQEQNMLSVAAGLALEGFLPFASTFGVFATCRAGDQLRNSIAYPKLNVKIGATHCGVTTGGDGASHQANEDIAITRSIPNLTILVPGDYAEAREATRTAAIHQGPVYLRLGRDSYPVLPEIHNPVEVGKAKVLSEGSDVAIISTGILLQEVFIAAEALLKQGLTCKVIHMPCIKPLDEKVVLDAAKETKGIITVEEHSILGGLGEAIAGTVSEHYPVRVIRIGMPDVFGESGQAGELLDKFGLRSKQIIAAAMKLLQD